MFKIDIIGLNIWRWSIRLPRLTLVGQVRGDTREEAETRSLSEINTLSKIAEARDANPTDWPTIEVPSSENAQYAADIATVVNKPRAEFAQAPSPAATREL